MDKMSLKVDLLEIVGGSCWLFKCKMMKWLCVCIYVYIYKYIHINIFLKAVWIFEIWKHVCCNGECGKWTDSYALLGFCGNPLRAVSSATSNISRPFNSCVSADISERLGSREYWFCFIYSKWSGKDNSLGK